MDRVADIHRAASLARNEFGSGMLDVARDFVRGVADNEPISDSKHWSDVHRRMPGTVADAAQSALDGAIGVPKRLINRFYGEYNMSTDRSATRKTSSRRSGGVTTRHGAGLSRAEQRVLDLVESFLAKVPGDGARLGRVVDQVVLETDYDRDIVTSIVKRNFLNNGNVLSKERVVDGIESKDSVKDYMRDKLQDRSFEDIREDVKLTGLSDLDDDATLVAYSGSKPVVLCYPVDEGDVENSGVQEAAIFQANAIAPGVAAKYAWVSDGKKNYIYDVEEDQVVTKLPEATTKSTASQHTSKQQV
jgi:hypothetical protein